MGVDDPDDPAHVGEDRVAVEGGGEVVDLAGEIPDLEVHESGKGFRRESRNGRSEEGAILHDILFLDRRGGFKEQGLMGGHLVEDDVRDGGFATSVGLGQP